MKIIRTYQDVIDGQIVTVNVYEPYTAQHHADKELAREIKKLEEMLGEKSKYRQ